MKKIEVIRCSKLARPMACAGSQFFENLAEQETNDAAKEGTAFGEHIERLLLGKDLPPVAANGVTIDEDMRHYAREFLAIANIPVGAPLLCEQAIDWKTRSGIMIKGSYDLSYVKNEELYIDDHKYGWKHVEAKENWQLLGYAIGEVIRRGEAFKFINLRIHQPRPWHEDGPIRTWKISYEQLIDYKEQIELRCEQLAAGFAQLATGPQCKYCPAAEQAACTAFNRSVFHGVDYVLNHFQQDHIDEKQIAFQLDLFGRIEDVLKIKADSIKQLAINRIQGGKIIPGYVTEETFGDRKWKKEVSPEVIKTLTGMDITEQVMLSPAKAEKLGVPKDLVKHYVDRFRIGNKLVKKDATKLAEKVFGKVGV